MFGPASFLRGGREDRVSGFGFGVSGFREEYRTWFDFPRNPIPEPRTPNPETRFPHAASGRYRTSAAGISLIPRRTALLTA